MSRLRQLLLFCWMLKTSSSIVLALIHVHVYWNSCYRNWLNKGQRIIIKGAMVCEVVPCYSTDKWCLSVRQWCRSHTLEHEQYTAQHHVFSCPLSCIKKEIPGTYFFKVLTPDGNNYLDINLLKVIFWECVTRENPFYPVHARPSSGYRTSINSNSALPISL